MQSVRAIADPTRRRIVELLAVRARTAGELVREFNLSASAISQHLKALRVAGLVSTRVKGQTRIQALNSDGFDDLEMWLKKRAHYGRVDAMRSKANGRSRAAPRRRNEKPSS